MGGISSRYTPATNNVTTPHFLNPVDKYQESSNVINYDEPIITGDISIPGDDINDVELNRIVNKQRQYYQMSAKEMRDKLHNLLQQIQLNILANNYNEKNKVLLNKMFNEMKSKQAELKDSKEANLADYRRIELIQTEIKQKNRTILFVIIAIIALIILMTFSFLLLNNNLKLKLPKLPKLTIPSRLLPK